MKFSGNRDFKRFSELLEGLGLKALFPLSLIDDTFYKGNYVSTREALMYPTFTDNKVLERLEIYFNGIDEVFIWARK